MTRFNKKIAAVTAALAAGPADSRVIRRLPSRRRSCDPRNSHRLNIADRGYIPEINGDVHASDPVRAFTVRGNKNIVTRHLFGSDDGKLRIRPCALQIIATVGFHVERNAVGMTGLKSLGFGHLRVRCGVLPPHIGGAVEICR